MVGCGYYPNEGVVFFTLNGTLLGNAPVADCRPYHAAVGADGPCRLVINVGQEPFRYEPPVVSGYGGGLPVYK